MLNFLKGKHVDEDLLPWIIENYMIRNNFKLNELRAMSSYEVYMHFRLVNAFKEAEHELSNPEKKVKSADEILGRTKKGGGISKKTVHKKFNPEVNDFI